MYQDTVDVLAKKKIGSKYSYTEDTSTLPHMSCISVPMYLTKYTLNPLMFQHAQTI